MKKVLSFVLVMTMVLSSMSFAFAGTSTFSDIAEDNDYAEAIDTLIALGVIDGYEDGTFRPEVSVTRAEMAKLMVQLLGYGNLVTGQKSNFTDTQGHWADQWIAIAAGRGIVIGTGGGNFTPESKVTYDEVLTMLVRGLGYTDGCNELKNMTWPTNFKVKASELNITKNVDMTTAEADRGGVAQSMRNALDQQMVKVNSNGDVEKQYKTTNSGDKRNDEKPIKLISMIAAEKDITVGFDHIDPASKDYAGDKVDLSKYLFQKVTVYCNRNNEDEVVYIGDSDSVTYSDTVDSIKAIDDKNYDYEIEIGDYTFKVPASVEVSFNSDQANMDDFDPIDDLEDANATVVFDEDEARVRDNAEVAGIVFEKASAYVQVEETYKDDATQLDEIYLPEKSGKVDSKNLVITGDAAKLSDIKEDDIVAAYAPYDDEDPTVDNPDRLKLVVTRKTVEGKVTGTADDAYYIDRTKYDLNDELGMDTLSIGDEGTFYLDENGKIIAFSGDSDTGKTYAVVDDDVYIDGEYKVSGSTGRYSVTAVPEVKINTSSDETVTYKFNIELDKDGKIKNDKLDGLFEVTKANSYGEGDINYVGADLFSKEENDSFGKLISYTLNKDNEITDFSVIERTIDMRTGSSSFVLASNAVIFDKDGNVIDEEDLGSTVKGTAAYSNGKIIALLTDIASEEGSYYYAYLTEFGTDSDDNGDEIQRMTAYIKGSKTEKLYTDDEDVVSEKEGLTVLKLNDDGDVIEQEKANDAVTVTPSAISDVKSKDGTFKVDGKTYYFDDGSATIIEKDGDDITVLKDIKAIQNVKSGDIKLYFNTQEYGKDTKLVGYIIIEK